MKIGIVGIGYWGNIILNNLVKMNYKDISLCDSNEKVFEKSIFKGFTHTNDFRKLECDKVFVCTITKNHYEIVKFF